MINLNINDITFNMKINHHLIAVEGVLHLPLVRTQNEVNPDGYRHSPRIITKR